MRIVLNATLLLLLLLFTYYGNASGEVELNATSIESDQLFNVDNISALSDQDDSVDLLHFTESERSHGAILIHMFGVIYTFILLTLICDKYFLPSVQCVCDDLSLPKDVAAATFMASATIAPEFFANLFGTFVTNSDVGIAGILGALLFDVLGVAAAASLATQNFIQLDWWPITRDSILYGSSVFLLTVFTWDGRITLIESIMMVSLLVVYFVVFIENRRIMHGIKWLIEINLNCCRARSYDFPTSYMENNLKTIVHLPTAGETKTERPKYQTSVSRSSINDKPIFMIYSNTQTTNENVQDNPKKMKQAIWQLPTGSRLIQFWWIFTWPIRIMLMFTVPNPKTHRRMYPLTFIMCILWIGVNSYVIVELLDSIGHTFGISEVVIGLTILAAGNCLPEAISSVLTVRKGDNGVGVSNSLGSCTLDILLSLGVPWLVKNVMHPEDGGVVLRSSSIQYTTILLFLSIIMLYVILTLAKYRLHASVGMGLIGAYILLATISLLLETNVISVDSFGL